MLVLVVGTPGHVFDMLRRQSLRSDNIKMFVLDEAVEMLSLVVSSIRYSCCNSSLHSWFFCFPMIWLLRSAPSCLLLLFGKGSSMEASARCKVVWSCDVVLLFFF